MPADKTPLPEQLGFSTAWFDLPGLRMHAAAAGPENAPLVILLHGFPEFWYSWRRQIGSLVDSGYRVIVPDQRGYNLTGKTPPYNLPVLVGDILNLIDACGREQVYLAGHDWGGIVAWVLAGLYPERVRRLVILNAPHPDVMFRALWGGSLRQFIRSWYIFLFQIPGLPEKLLGRGDHTAMVRMLQRSSSPGTFKPEDVPFYRGAWSQPGALSAMIGWYRQIIRSAARYSYRDFAFRLQMPTRILWGEQDSAMGVELAEQSLNWLDQGDLVRFPEATHWVHQDLPDAVNQHILEHFSGKAVIQNS
jgi:epoxide hydrolase 4